MKKVVILLCIGILLVSSSLAVAAPVGNPASPKILSSKVMNSEKWVVGVGGEFDFVLDSKIEDIDDADLRFYLGKVVCTLAERVDIYGMLGGANGTFKESYGATKIEWETESSFAWGVGATALLHEFDNGVLCGVAGRYQQTDPDVESVTVDGVKYSLPSGTVSSVSLEYQEWQLALGLAKEFDKCVPYGGVKFSKVDTTLKAVISGTPYTSDSADRDNNFGIFAGIDIIPAENFLLNVEGRVLDEYAVNVSARVKF